MSTAITESPRIDRLSSLPPELLLSIFDLAYDPDSPILEPLSRRLLPYVRHNLYRKIHISSLASFDKLLDTMERYPGLGELVKDLDTSDVFAFTPRHDIRGDFSQIHDRFPFVTSLKTGYVRPLNATWSGFAPGCLKHLSYECEIITIEDLYVLEELQVESLEIRFRFPCEGLTLPAPRIESVTTLVLVNEPSDIPWRVRSVWDSSMVKIVNSFPNITSLRLFDAILPDYRTLLSGLNYSATLTSLELDSPSFPRHNHFFCDTLLHRFPNLTYLSLCDGSSSATLSTNLLQLPKLASLRLGPAVHLMFRDQDLLNLVQGSTRLPALRLLIPDFLDCPMGYRVDLNVYGRSPSDTAMWEQGWRLPQIYGITRGGVEELFNACRREGIVVGGRGVRFLEIYQAYALEQENRRAIESVYRLRLLSNPGGDGQRSLYDANVDGLPSAKYPLIKTQDPETNWFRLSFTPDSE